MRRWLAGVWLLVSWLFGASVFSAEAVREFHADIEVLRDGGLRVTETIRVRAEGQEIRRGIYRDFPTDYRDRQGNRVRVGFEVLEASRDGRPEPYRTSRQGNGVRVYLGEAERTLAPGEYSYRLSYRTDRQLGFFADHDELYWNLTGNGWIFPIERASARVRLPHDVPWERIGVEGYTGPQGARGQAYRAKVHSSDEVRIETTAPFAPQEGLTLVVTWPKGFVTEPSGADRLAAFAGDNREAIGGGIGLLITLGWYLYAWLRVGRDPYPGPIAPLYEPPAGFSPASVRFIRRMGYDQKTFAAALVNLAVKGYLRIEQGSAGRFNLERTGAEAELAPGEQALTRALFPAGRRRFEVTKGQDATLAAAIKAHQAALSRDYEKLYFRTNRAWVVPGALAGLLTIGLSVLLLPSGRGDAGFLVLWLLFWTLGVGLLTWRVVAAWRAARGLLASGGALFITLFAVPFWGAELLVLWVLAGEGSPALSLIVVAVPVLILVFYQLLKAPTLAGRQLLDRIEGFRLYLAVAEGDELAARGAPSPTPELFERYLPYALALDVEQPWSERFSDTLARAQVEGQRGYRPSWYDGPDWHRLGAQGFAGALGGGLASAIAASSTAPGSSSGSGGGGSSGGGGGGGGGGGW